MTYLHLAYLQQVSDLIEEQHKPLAAHLGYIAKKISSKHLVAIKGHDPQKLRRCKACQSPITGQDIRPKERSIVIKCPLCHMERKYSSSKRLVKDDHMQTDSGNLQQTSADNSGQ